VHWDPAFHRRGPTCCLESLFKEKVKIMKYERPVAVAVAAVKAIQGSGGTIKPIASHPDQLNVEFPATLGAYEADE
jgi:hypothetical protein